MDLEQRVGQLFGAHLVKLRDLKGGLNIYAWLTKPTFDDLMFQEVVELERWYKRLLPPRPPFVKALHNCTIKESLSPRILVSFPNNQFSGTSWEGLANGFVELPSHPNYETLNWRYMWITITNRIREFPIQSNPMANIVRGSGGGSAHNRATPIP